MTQMLVHLILAQRSLRLSSILFILFPLVCSSAVISTILSSRSLIYSSTSVILLSVTSRVFLTSVIVLFISVCLFFIYSMSLVIVLTVLNVSSFSLFYFQVFGASLPSLFSILFQIDRLFPLHLFGLVSFYLVLSFVLYLSVFSSFFSYLAPLEVSFSQAWRSYSFFLPQPPPLERKVGWVVCVAFLLGVTCACVLITGNLACPLECLGSSAVA